MRYATISETMTLSHLRQSEFNLSDCLSGEIKDSENLILHHANP
jgi:hypothetical protein